MARHNGNDNIVGKVALGATGVALAAGGIAAAALLTNRNNRVKVRKAADTTFKKMGEVKNTFQAGMDRFQTYQHRIGIGKGKKDMGGMMKKSAHAGKKRGRK